MYSITPEEKARRAQRKTGPIAFAEKYGLKRQERSFTSNQLIKGNRRGADEWSGRDIDYPLLDHSEYYGIPGRTCAARVSHTYVPKDALPEYVGGVPAPLLVGYLPVPSWYNLGGCRALVIVAPEMKHVFDDDVEWIEACTPEEVPPVFDDATDIDLAKI